MKPISRTCIICGTLAFLAPMLFQGFCGAFVAYALANSRLSPMSISAPSLPPIYYLASVIFGAVLTLVGILAAVPGDMWGKSSGSENRGPAGPSKFIAAEGGHSR